MATQAELFQSPCRDWWPSSPQGPSHAQEVYVFQSPCRDWWPSSLLDHQIANVGKRFQSPCRDWWPSSAASYVSARRCQPSFNPPVGIGGLQARIARPLRILSRISFNPPVGIGGLQAAERRHPVDRFLDVSIPLSGLVAFKRYNVHHHHRRRRCFNPPVGIGGLQAPAASGEKCAESKVSIPLSGLVAFKPRFGRGGADGGDQFQSPCRDWWPSSAARGASGSEPIQFQSPCRDWWPSSLATPWQVKPGSKGFNPPVGIGGLQANPRTP